MDKNYIDVILKMTKTTINLTKFKMNYKNIIQNMNKKYNLMLMILNKMIIWSTNLL